MVDKLIEDAEFAIEHGIMSGEIALLINRMILELKKRSWQPIETAPRDQWVDIWYDGERIPKCKWEGDFNAFVSECYGVLDRIEPTHWMPLPEVAE